MVAGESSGDGASGLFPSAGDRVFRGKPCSADAPLGKTRQHPCFARSERASKVSSPNLLRSTCLGQAGRLPRGLHLPGQASAAVSAVFQTQEVAESVSERSDHTHRGMGSAAASRALQLRRFCLSAGLKPTVFCTAGVAEWTVGGRSGSKAGRGATSARCGRLVWRSSRKGR